MIRLAPRRPHPLRDDGARFATFVDEDGELPCPRPDACPACRLFSHQRPDETRTEWLARVSADLTEFRMHQTGAPVSTIKTEGEQP